MLVAIGMNDLSHPPTRTHARTHTHTHTHTPARHQGIRRFPFHTGMMKQIEAQHLY
jgi:hypothetical protein